MTGKTLKLLAEELLKHVDASPLFDQWLETWTNKCASGLRDGPLLKVAHGRLCANFDQQRIELAREVDCLRRLNFRVPETIALVADEARQRIQVAHALRSACRLYDRCSSHISDDDACMLQPGSRLVGISRPKRSRPRGVRPRGSRGRRPLRVQGPGSIHLWRLWHRCRRRSTC